MLGYDQPADTPPLAPVTARVRAEARRSAHAVRHALAALDYQETINFSFVEERWEHELAGNADPIRVLNPIAAPLAVMRSSLIGSLVQRAAHSTWRARPTACACSRSAACSRATRRWPTATLTRGRPAPADARGRPGLRRRRRLQWGSAERAVDFFDVKGDVEALLAPRRPRFVPAAHPALHPGRCAARRSSTAAAIGFVGELHPRWRQAYELPQAPMLFELDLDAVLDAPVPVFEPMPRQQSAWRDLALVVRDEVSHDALMARARRDDPAGLVRAAPRCSTSTSPRTPAAGIAGRRAQPGGAAGTAGRRGHADRRAHRGRRGRRGGTRRAAPSARGCAPDTDGEP